MSDDYLWDRSGAPDPEVRRLEEALASLRHAPSPEQLLARLETKPVRYSRWDRWVAAAVIVVTFGVATASWWRRHDAARDRVTPDASHWAVSRLEGTPRLDGRGLTGKHRPAHGDLLETGAGARARIQVGSVGRVDVRAHSRLRLLNADGTRYRLALERGSLHATIWAPPGRFLVDTPSARAIDMGCAYTLDVDDSGGGLLTVESGWVAFEHRGRESFVPAGAQCRTHRQQGPGVPYFLDAPAALRDALDRLDDRTAARRGLEEVLAHARPRDAMTLWHLLSRVSPGDRALVYESMAALVPPPPDVSRVGILEADRAMLDSWWDELGLGSSHFWREWKRMWPADAPSEAAAG